MSATQRLAAGFRPNRACVVTRRPSIFTIGTIGLALITGCATPESSRRSGRWPRTVRAHPEFTAARVAALRAGLSMDDVRALFGEPDETSASVYGTRTPHPWQATKFVYRMERDDSYDLINVYKTNELVFSNEQPGTPLDHWNIEVIYPDQPGSGLSTVPESVALKVAELDELTRIAQVFESETDDPSGAGSAKEPLWWIVEAERILAGTITADDDTKTWIRLAELYAEVGMPRMARNRLAYAYSLLKNSADRWLLCSEFLLLAQAFAESGDLAALLVSNDYLDCIQKTVAADKLKSVLLYPSAPVDVACVHATLGRQLAKEGKAEQALGQFGHAQALAARVEDISGIAKFNALVHLARCQAEAHLEAEARESLSDAMDYPRPMSMRMATELGMGQFSVPPLVNSLLEATSALTNAGRRAEVQELLRRASNWALERFDGQWAVWALMTIANSQQEWSDTAGAAATIAESRNCVSQLASDLDELRQLLAGMSDIENSVNLCPLATALAFIGDNAGCISTLQRVQDPNERAILAGKVASQLLEVAHAETAREILQAVDEMVVDSPRGLVELAESWAKLHQPRRAAALLARAEGQAAALTLQQDNMIAYEASRGLALDACAVEYAKSGDLAAIADLGGEVTCVGEVAEAYAKHNPAAPLREWLTSLQIAEHKRAGAYLGAAKGLLARR